MAALTRDGFIAELNSRGWTRFATAEKERYCDWGLRDVVREAKWADTAEVAVLTNISTPTIAFSAVNAAGVRQIQRVNRKTADDEGWLKPMGDDEFFRDWLYVDMADSSYKGSPTRYYVYNEKIYLILAPDQAHDFDVYHIMRINAFANGGAESGLPERFDEAILLAIECHCFRRAHETERLAVAQAELRRIILAELVEDGQQWEERDRRVVPHR